MPAQLLLNKNYRRPLETEHKSGQDTNCFSYCQVQQLDNHDFKINVGQILPLHAHVELRQWEKPNSRKQLSSVTCTSHGMYIFLWSVLSWPNFLKIISPIKTVKKKINSVVKNLTNAPCLTENFIIHAQKCTYKGKNGSWTSYRQKTPVHSIRKFQI